MNKIQIFMDGWKLKFIKKFKLPHKKVIKLLGHKIHFGNIKQLSQIYHEIFIEKIYSCQLGNNPTIIDAGANIGLSTIFFKIKFPDAKIIAFEPHPDTFKLLKLNIEKNEIKNVEIHNVALSGKEETIKFFSSSDMPLADIGMSTIKQHVEYFHLKKGNTIEINVPSKKLSTFIEDKVDLLKLDIEGSECEVISELDVLLSKINNIIMEYHYHYTYSNNPLSKIIQNLIENSHIYKIFPTTFSKKLDLEGTYTICSSKN